MNRSLSVAANILRSNFSDLRYPYRINFIVTYECHFRCQMCNIWKKTPHDELTLDQIDKFFTTSNHFSWVTLTGGEIFQRKDLLPIAKTIDKRCPHLYVMNMTTNGYHTDRTVEFVKEALSACRFPKLVLVVSIDGPPSLHDKIRNIPGSWEKAIKTYESLLPLKSKKFEIFLGMTLQPSNLDSFEETLKAVKERAPAVTVNDFHISLLEVSTHYFANSNIDKKKDRQKLLARFNEIMNSRKVSSWDLHRFVEKKFQQHAETYFEKNINPITCQAASASFFMDPSGTVYPCSIWDNPIGNIKDFDYDLYKLWDTTHRREIRSLVSAGKCPHCWIPCEAYQSILADLVPKSWKKVKFLV